MIGEMVFTQSRSCHFPSPLFLSACNRPSPINGGGCRRDRKGRKCHFGLFAALQPHARAWLSVFRTTAMRLSACARTGRRAGQFGHRHLIIKSNKGIPLRALRSVRFLGPPAHAARRRFGDWQPIIKSKNQNNCAAGPEGPSRKPCLPNRESGQICTSAARKESRGKKSFQAACLRRRAKRRGRQADTT